MDRSPSKRDPTRERGRPFCRRPGILPAAVCIAVSVSFLFCRSSETASALHGLPLDDAWIHMVYARSIGLTGKPCYNPGVMESGMTSPLWALLLSIPFALGLGARPEVPVIFAKALSILFWALGCVTLGEILLSFSNRRWLPSLLGALGMALSPWMAFAAVSGMEVNLFVFLSLFSILLFSRGRGTLSALAAGLAAVTRPEGLLLVVLIPALLLFRAAKGERSRFPRAALAGIVPFLLWVVYSLAATGRPFPNPYYVKHVSISARSFVCLWNLFRGLLPSRPMAVPFIAMYLLGVALLARTRRPSALLFALYPWLFLTGVGLTRWMPEGFEADFYWIRYAIPALPFLVVPPWFALGRALSEKGPTLVRPGAAILLLLFLSSSLSGLKGKAVLFSWNTRNIEEMNVALGRWIRRRTEPGARIAVNDAGALRYFGERFTVDLIGLNDHSLHWRGNPAEYWERVFSYRPDYFAVFPSWFPNVASSSRFEEIFRVKASRYTVITGSPQDTLVIYRVRPSAVEKVGTEAP